MTKTEAKRWKNAWASTQQRLLREMRAQPVMTAAESFARSEDLTRVAAQQLGWPLPQSAYEKREEQRVRALWTRLTRKAKAHADRRGAQAGDQGPVPGAAAYSFNGYRSSALTRAW